MQAILEFIVGGSTTGKLPKSFSHLVPSMTINHSLSHPTLRLLPLQPEDDHPDDHGQQSTDFFAPDRTTDPSVSQHLPVISGDADEVAAEVGGIDIGEADTKDTAKNPEAIHADQEAQQTSQSCLVLASQPVTMAIVGVMITEKMMPTTSPSKIPWTILAAQMFEVASQSITETK